jgi:hypothetical protein
MAISKWYHDMDSLDNTVAVLLYSLEQLHIHPGLRVLPSSTADTIAAFPASVPSYSDSWLWRSLHTSLPFSIPRIFGQTMVRRAGVQIT